MICGTCKKPMKTIRTWKKHLAETGCAWRRDVWVRVLAAHQRGSSGRRILSDAFPDLYKRVPMSEETKERLRELSAQRVKVDHARVREKLRARG